MLFICYIYLLTHPSFFQIQAIWLKHNRFKCIITSISITLISFWILPNHYGINWWNFKKLNLVEQTKRLLNIAWWLFLVEIKNHWIFYKYSTIKYINLFCFILSTTHMGKWHESKYVYLEEYITVLYHLQNLKVFI